MCRMTEDFSSEKHLRLRLSKEPERKVIIENKCTLTSEYENNPTVTIKAPPPTRTIERRIGRATFIVSSRFSAEGKEKDIVSTLSRLIQHDSGRPE